MHDIDRVQLETSPEFEQLESGSFEYEQLEAGPFESEQFEAGPFEYREFGTNESEAGERGETGAVFNEAQEMELASELLEVSNEAALEGFLRSFIKRAARAAGGVLNSRAGQAIGGILKGAAKQVLPTIGSSGGSYSGGVPCACLGNQGAPAAGRLFGLELEGLSAEDQEFEVARRYVRFAGDAVRNMTRASSTDDLRGAARNAALEAARMHAPGFVRHQPAARPGDPTESVSSPAFGRSGRWLRRGHKIILYGA